MSTANQQSNPFSTGQGRAFFEARVQAAFTAAMLCGGTVSCLAPWSIQQIKLQGSYAGYETDDCIVCVRNPQHGSGRVHTADPHDRGEGVV